MDPHPHPPITAPTTTLLNHPESALQEVEGWRDEPLPNVPGGKVRLMCSYGGHIMPRPHHKSLSYVGGETRMVAVDRHSSLKDLCTRLSLTLLLHARPFTLKYQLPNEDLDNLITVTTDEDLHNMIQEYDRLASASSRLRIFLFFCKPYTVVSTGSLLDYAKSDTWFVDALNSSGILSRVVSDSAAVECLVNLPASGSSNDLVADSNKQVKHLPDVHSVPGSPVVEINSSSYGSSSSSSSSMANLPPIRVPVDDNGGSRIQQEQQRLVMEELFAQMTFATGGVKQDDGYAISSSVAALAPMPAIPAPVTVASATTADEDRSDHHEATAGFRKPPLPLQLVQPRTSGGFSLPSPDSVASDSSIASANSFPKAVYYQEQVQAAYVDSNAPALPNIKNQIYDHSHGLLREQVQDSVYTLPQQLDQNKQLQQQQQQQFVYIHHPAATGQVPVSSYYSVYAPPSHQQLNHPIGQQQYPVYLVPAGPTQPYNMTMQSNIGDSNMVATGRPLLPQSAAASAAYKDGTPPIYPTKSATPTIPDVAPSVYKAPLASNPAFVQIPSNHFQQQYVGLPQNIHPPPQPIAIAPSATTNYGYEYGGPTQDQAYYTQQQAAPQPPQYQSMNPAAVAAALSDVSKQFPTDNFTASTNRLGEKTSQFVEDM